MPWLADTDLSAAHGFAGALLDTRTSAELRAQALQALADLVPADVLTWDRVDVATGVVTHDVSEAFDVVVAEAENHPLVAAHAAGPRPALRVSESVERPDSSRGDVLHLSGFDYGIAIGVRTGHGETVVTGFGRTECQFSERDRDVLDLVRPALEEAVRATEARGRLDRAQAADPPSATAIVLLDRAGEIALSSTAASRWLAEHFGTGDHAGWLPGPIAEWLSLPPRPPLVSVRDGRRLTVWLLPGDPHALLLEEEVASFRDDALARLGLTPREVEVLRAASVLHDEADIAWELTLSVHAVRERLGRLEDKLGVRTVADAVARALRESE